MRRAYLALPIAAALGVVAFACSKPVPNLTVREYMPDAGAGVTADVGAATDSADAEADAQPDANLNLGGPCTDDSQCDEHIACEYFRCDATYGRCSYTPDNSQCQDGIYCDGQEQCVLHHGCASGMPVTCDDGNPCTIDHCDEQTMTCVDLPRDADQDGDPDDHCFPHHDCNDMDPNVSSKHAEVCGNHIDDNCNGLIDEMPCVVVQGGTCVTAVTLPGPGDYSLTTLGANPTFTTSCTVSSMAGSENVVANVLVPPGPNVDLDVWATSSGEEMALAIDQVCGQPTTELTCNSDPGALSMHARARNVAPGMYSIVVTTQAPTDFELDVAFLTPTPKAPNQTCATAVPLTIGTPVAVSIIDPSTELASACPTNTGLLTYSFTLTQAADVRVYTDVVDGAGTLQVGLRDPHCVNAADEVACALSGARPLFARNQPPGTYVVTVGASAPVDATLVVQTSVPTTAPADDSCATAPTIMLGADVPVDLSNNTDGIKDGCLQGGIDAAFDLPIASPSDVLLVGRFPQGDYGGVSLDDATCTPTGELACSVDGTPARVGKRNVPPGDYRAVLSDSQGQMDTFMVLTRPTVPPVSVSGVVSCMNQPVTIPPTGGYFAGDTSKSTPFVEEGCDAPGLPTGGAPDQTLTLTLPQAQRVIFDMEGSSYETLLALYQGAPCPGVQFQNACYVGFDSQRSFLDVDLPAGQYWVIVDGYDGAKGTWNLAVWVVPP